MDLFQRATRSVEFQLSLTTSEIECILWIGKKIKTEHYDIVLGPKLSLQNKGLLKQTIKDWVVTDAGKHVCDLLLIAGYGRKDNATTDRATA